MGENQLSTGIYNRMLKFKKLSENGSSMLMKSTYLHRVCVYKEESADIVTLQTQLPLHCCELNVPALLQGQGLQYGYP